MTSTQHGSTQHPPVAGALPWVDGRELHPRLEGLLQRVQDAERAAVGEHRRPTFKLMRELLGASVGLGVPGQLLAECLGTSRGSVRNRAVSSDGTLTAELIQKLTELTPRQLDRLSKGELTRDGDKVDRAAYPTVDVVRALLNTPRPKPRKPAATPAEPAADDGRPASEASAGRWRR
jgi:hypothetical protein